VSIFIATNKTNNKEETMIAKETNRKAMNALSQQNFTEAQHLFFENAKRNPSHQTYNNLGYYLISEGLECKGGKVRNALKLGIKYLNKASEIDSSVTNICSKVEAINLMLRGVKNEEEIALYQEAYDLLNKALKIDYSDELQHNMLRFSYLINPYNKENIEKAKKLTEINSSYEIVSLYFCMLSANSLVKEGNNCIEKFGHILDSADMLLFYAKTNQYEKGGALCKTVIEEFCIDEPIASAIVECLINSGNHKDLKNYINTLEQEIKENPFLTQKALRVIERNSPSSSEYRKNIINSFYGCPPYFTRCCYFGCEMHSSPW